MKASDKPSHDGRPDDNGGLSYPCGTPPEPGHGREIRPGVRWLRMHLPWALTHINLYALADDDGWAMVDTGAQTRETLASWTRALAAEDALAGKRITRGFVTHMHPDHVGMAGWLTRRFDARLWMTRLEYLTCRTLVADTGREAPDDAIRFYRRAGWKDDEIEHYRAIFGGFGRVVYALPDSFRRLHDGERVRIGAHEWCVIVGNGHSPEHACFYCEELKMLISGDQVLPRISSNVSVFPTEPDADPLGDFQRSLPQYLALPGDCRVFPAHGAPFLGLHERVSQLALHHDQRLERTLEACAAPATAAEVLRGLFTRPLDAHQTGFALAETLAHLNRLLRTGQLERWLESDGVYRYRAR